VSVAERGHDPGWLMLRVYDDHQPTAWSYVLLEESLSVQPGIWLSMIRPGNGVEYGLEMGLKLDMAAVLIEHVLQPSVLEEHHSHSLGSRCLGEDGPWACLWAVGQGCWSATAPDIAGCC
jgi:hypothetical protein